MNALAAAPAPDGRFPDGHLRLYARDPLSFLTAAARLGPIVRLRFGTTRACLVSEPGLIEDVLVTRSRDYVKTRSIRAHRYLFGRGLLTNEGESWLRQRRLAQPAFRRERLAAYGAVMTEAALRMLSACRDGETRDVHEDMKGLTSAIAARTLFGGDVERDTPDLASALEAVMGLYERRRGLSRLVPECIPIPQHVRYRRAVGRLDRVVLSFIRARRASGAPGDDLLSMLLAARDEDGRGMSDRQLRDEVMTLFLGGYDTPALGLTWLVHLLACHPAAAAALEAEVDDVLGGRTPEPADLPALRFAEAAVLESMRLYPPAWILGREAARPTTLGEFAIPKGTLVLASQWVVHRQAAFFDDPDAFVPERWLDGLEKRLPKYAYFPFGAGPRVCIGASFAMMEAVLVIALFAQRFRPRAAGSMVRLWPTLTLRPRHGVCVTLAARQPQAAPQGRGLSAPDPATPAPSVPSASVPV